MDGIRAALASLTEQLESMSTRDRNLATITMMLVAVAMVGAITWQLQSVIADRASRVVLAKQNLLQVQQDAETYQDLQQRLTDAKTRMGEFQPDSMSTYIDKWAAEAGVSTGLRNIQEVDSTTTGTFKERDFNVKLERVELDGLIKFLHAIETSSYPIKVRTANFRVKESRKERTINLDLDLVTFSVEEG